VGIAGNPGDQLLFQIGVQMVADLSQYPILKCGKLAGLTFPPKGPVRGVNINWDPILWGAIDNYADLKENGTIVRQDAVTDSNGLASLVFQPKDEPEATMSTRQTDKNIVSFSGTLSPSAAIATSFGNILAFGSEVLMPKTVTFYYIIEMHSGYGWKIDLYLPTFADPETHFYGLSCASPYGPWEINYEGTSTVGEFIGSMHIPFAENGKVTGTFEDQSVAYGGLDGADRKGTYNPKITQNNGKYQIDFGSMTITGTYWAGPNSVTNTTTAPGWVFPITQADASECPPPP
jgi:hypothetical protein